ncbi:amidohydrolase [bacterium]|nr:amidohydrolase [bacterium]
MNILIRHALLGDEEKDILILENTISRIASNIEEPADKIIEARGKAVFPSFFNAHTHAGMTLFRGFGDDLPLMEWLETRIWPYEALIKEEDVYWGTKLACLEMIKSGTTFFNDMYWFFPAVARAVEDMKIRSAVSAVFIDQFDDNQAHEQIRHNKELFGQMEQYSSRISFSLGPHAPYTVSLKSLKWARDFAADNDILIHIHLSETEDEVQRFVKVYGKRPFEYLHEIGFLSPRLIAVHTVWLNELEMDLIAENGVHVVHNPISNMKLAVGSNFKYRELKERGVNICLGTDGAGSNNNLDMIESMKFAALLQKFSYNDPTILPALEIFNMATCNGAKAFRLNAGKIEEGKLADLILVDLNNPSMVPGHNHLSDLVYAAHGDCVDTVICDGNILMEDRKVEGEEEILKNARKAAFDFISRKK